MVDVVLALYDWSGLPTQVQPSPQPPLSALVAHLAEASRGLAAVVVLLGMSWLISPRQMPSTLPLSDTARRMSAHREGVT